MSEARASLPSIVERVIAGEEVTLTRHGEPVAVIVRPDLLRQRRAGAALAAATALNAALHRGGASPLTSAPTLSEQRADELAADVRAARSGR